MQVCISNVGHKYFVVSPVSVELPAASFSCYFRVDPNTLTRLDDPVVLLQEVSAALGGEAASASAEAAALLVLAQAATREAAGAASESGNPRVKAPLLRTPENSNRRTMAIVHNRLL